MFRTASLVIICLCIGACSVLEKKEPEQTGLDFKSAVAKPLPPEKTEELLNETGSNWLYGQGMGETVLTAGTIFAFPPYAIYVVGNGILNLAGYKELRFSDALPDEGRKVWNETYDTVTSGPGRFSAAIAGREFRTREVAKERIQSIIKQD